MRAAQRRSRRACGMAAHFLARGTTTAAQAAAGRLGWWIDVKYEVKRRVGRLRGQGSWAGKQNGTEFGKKSRLKD
jgi:hypothetical protein